MERHHGYVRVDGETRLFYETLGSGQETVLIPNARQLARDFVDLMDYRRLIFYDQRGRGGSDPIADEALIWTDYEIQDIQAIVDGLELQPMSLIGWSYMAAIVSLYALEHPGQVKRLVLSCPIAIRHPAPYDQEEAEAWERSETKIDPDELERLNQMKADGLDGRDPAAYCRQHNRVYFPRQMADPDAFDRMKSEPWIYAQEWPENLSQHWARHFPESSRLYDWRDRLSMLRVPTLVIHGLEDLHPLRSSQEWVASFADARLLVIRRCGHFPHLEAPEVFFPAVSKFLKGQWPTEAVEVRASDYEG